MVLLPKNLNKIKMPMANVLILDYSSDAKEAERILTHSGYRVAKCGSFKSGIEEARLLPRDSLILSAYRLVDGCVSEFISKMRSEHIHHPVIVYDRRLDGKDVRDALSESKAKDFLQPQTFGKTLIEAVRRHMPTARHKGMAMTMYQQKGVAARNLHKRINLLAKYEENTLIVSEKGCGKERVAIALHMESNMNGKPLVILDHREIEFGRSCNAECPLCIIKEKFMEANGGTLIIKNIHNFCNNGLMMLNTLMMNPELDVRVIATADSSIYALVKDGKFDMELLSNLSATKLEIGNLRDNPDNYEWLALFILAEFCAQYGRESIGIEPIVLAMLKAYPFPGNEAEYECVIRQCATNCEGNTIGYRDVPLNIVKVYEESLISQDFDLSDPDVIQTAINNTKTYAEAAQTLNVSTRTFFNIRKGMPQLKKRNSRSI